MYYINYPGFPVSLVDNIHRYVDTVYSMYHVNYPGFPVSLVDNIPSDVSRYRVFYVSY